MFDLLDVLGGAILLRYRFRLDVSIFPELLPQRSHGHTFLALQSRGGFAGRDPLSFWVAWRWILSH